MSTNERQLNIEPSPDPTSESSEQEETLPSKLTVPTFRSPSRILWEMISIELQSRELSVPELVRDAGISFETLRRCQKGNTNPTLPTVRRICSYFQWDPYATKAWMRSLSERSRLPSSPAAETESGARVDIQFVPDSINRKRTKIPKVRVRRKKILVVKEKPKVPLKQKEIRVKIKPEPIPNWENDHSADLTDELWKIIQPLVERRPNIKGGPSYISRREIVNALLYMENGQSRSWRGLENVYPSVKWELVRYYSETWKNNGTWRQVKAALSTLGPSTEQG